MDVEPVWMLELGLRWEHLTVTGTVLAVLALVQAGLWVLHRRGMIGRATALGSGIVLAVLCVQGATMLLAWKAVVEARSISCGDEYATPRWGEDLQADMRETMRSADRAESAAREAAAAASEAARELRYRF